MSTKGQFKMYLDEDMIERLKQAATRFSRDSGQDVVEEIISIYLPTWVAVNESMRRAIEFQNNKLAKESERLANASKGIPVAPRSTSRPIPFNKKHVESNKRRVKS